MFLFSSYPQGPQVLTDSRDPITKRLLVAKSLGYGQVYELRCGVTGVRAGDIRVRQGFVLKSVAGKPPLALVEFSLDSGRPCASYVNWGPYWECLQYPPEKLSDLLKFFIGLMAIRDVESIAEAIARHTAAEHRTGVETP